MNTIKCTMGDIVKGVPAFGRLREQKLPIIVSLDIRRIAVVIDAEYEVYIEAEKELLDQHGEKNDDGSFCRPPLVNEDGMLVLGEDGIPVSDESKIHIRDNKLFQKDMDMLFSAELVLTITPLKLSKISHLSISPNDIEALFFIIEDDISEPKIEVPDA